MYVSPNFKSKKALKEAVSEWMAYRAYVKDPLSVEGVNYGLTHNDSDPKLRINHPPIAVRVFQPMGDITGFNPGPYNGVEYIEGPHYPQPHRWYAKVIVNDGIVQKVS